MHPAFTPGNVASVTPLPCGPHALGCISSPVLIWTHPNDLWSCVTYIWSQWAISLLILKFPCEMWCLLNVSQAYQDKVSFYSLCRAHTRWRWPAQDCNSHDSLWPLRSLHKLPTCETVATYTKIEVGRSEMCTGAGEVAGWVGVAYSFCGGFRFGSQHPHDNL